MSRAHDPAIQRILGYSRAINLQNPEYAAVKKILEEGVDGRFNTEDKGEILSTAQK